MYGDSPVCINQVVNLVKYYSGNTYKDHLANAVTQKTTTRDAVNTALSNSYRMRFRMGLFDPNVSTVYDNITKDAIG